jgi:hypothetical protein
VEAPGVVAVVESGAFVVALFVPVEHQHQQREHVSPPIRLSLHFHLVQVQMSFEHAPVSKGPAATVG